MYVLSNQDSEKKQEKEEGFQANRDIPASKHQQLL
jgi:hypothetical protein